MPDTSVAMLGAGYALAVPFSIWPPGFKRLWRRREPAVIAAELVGTGLLVGGWAMRGRPSAVMVNVAWGLGLAAAYVVEGRRRARRTTSEGATPP